MKGIRFGILHSYNDFGLILSEREIGSPAVKGKKIDVEGSDGELDYTEFFGGVKYGNRKLKYKFSKAGISPKEFLSFVSDLQDKLHGLQAEVVDDDDPNYKYIGRISVADFSCKNRIGEITVEVDAEPYKLKKTVTKVTQAVITSADIVLTNSRKPVVPTITTDATMTLAFGGHTAAVQAGTFRLSELQLNEGKNTVTVTGTGNISFEYTEGRL